jgi:hypothetical protein
LRHHEDIAIERPLPVRIGKRGFAARIKGNLRVAFGDERLSSHAGLELVRRYLGERGLGALLRTSERRLPRRGDLSFGSMVLLVVAMLLVGGRRLRHVEYLDRDPLVERIAGLRRVPSRRTLARRLAALRKADMDELDRLVLASATDPIRPLSLPRLTIDVDGSVLTTGLTVAGAERGYNPHHRKNPSYYPILATLAQTGAAIADRNRPGNIHDSHRRGGLPQDHGDPTARGAPRREDDRGAGRFGLLPAGFPASVRSPGRRVRAQGSDVALPQPSLGGAQGRPPDCGAA